MLTVKLKRSEIEEEAKAEEEAQVADAEEEDAVEDEDEDEQSEPEILSLKWQKEGREISEALVDDEVTLYCEVKNIDDGERVKFSIFEKGESKDDPIDDFEGTVKNSEVEVPWTVVYKGGEGSNCAEELEAQGWVLPLYYFVAEYNGAESRQGKILEAKGWGNQQIICDETGNSLGNYDYALLTCEGKIIMGKTDANGYIKHDGIKIGEFTLIRGRGKHGR
jgi:hypothetical protein